MHAVPLLYVSVLQAPSRVTTNERKSKTNGGITNLDGKKRIRPVVYSAGIRRQIFKKKKKLVYTNTQTLHIADGEAIAPGKKRTLI